MRLPKYSHHSTRNKAYANWHKKRKYFDGPYNSPESRAHYFRWLGEIGAKPDEVPKGDLRVEDLVERYLNYASVYYRGGKEYQQLRYATSVLVSVHGLTLVVEFGPKAAKDVQAGMVKRGWTRPHINRQMVRVRRVFRWGVAEELVSSSVLEALRSMEPLKLGRTIASEPDPIEPVPAGAFERTLPSLSPVVADMARLQEATGMRSDNLCRIRPMDIDRNKDSRGDVWIYRPEQHKARWRGSELRILLGPRAQAILAPYLDGRALDAYCFSPRESEERRHALMRKARKTRVQPSHAARKPKKRPKHPRRDHYDSSSYWKAICRGIKTANRKEKAKVDAAQKQEKIKATKEHRKPAAIPDYIDIPSWHPHQLRHSIATEIRKRFGLEGSQVFLGHARADVTQIYAERDLGLAFKIASELG